MSQFLYLLFVLSTPFKSLNGLTVIFFKVIGLLLDFVTINLRVKVKVG